MASSQLSPGCWWNKKKSKLMMLESFAESVSARMQLKTTIWTMMDGDERESHLSRRWQTESGQFWRRSRSTDLFCSSSSYIFVSSISWLRSSLYAPIDRLPSLWVRFRVWTNLTLQRVALFCSYTFFELYLADIILSRRRLPFFSQPELATS